MQRLNLRSQVRMTSRYQLYQQPHDTWPKPYNIHDNLDPSRKDLNLKHDE